MASPSDMPSDSTPESVTRMMNDDRASRALGMELLRSSEGFAAVRMPVTAAMVNGHGIAHGCYVFAVADTAFACACNSYGPVTVASGADIDFVAPAREGDHLLAEARVRSRFGRGGIYDVTVRRAGQRDATPHATTGVIAEFRGRSRTIYRTEAS